MPHWLSFIFDKIILSILVSLATSSFFLMALSRFRPKIDISPKIAQGLSTKSNKTVYRIKVINRTRAPLTDIKAQLHIFKNYQTATGEVWKSKSIELKCSDPISIDQYNRDDKDANYAYRFLTYENLEKEWSDDSTQFLRFRMFSRHSVSGFGSFFYKDYRLKRNTIYEGDFSKGDIFEIV